MLRSFGCEIFEYLRAQSSFGDECESKSKRESVCFVAKRRGSWIVRCTWFYLWLRNEVQHVRVHTRYGVHMYKYHGHIAHARYLVPRTM